MSNKDFKTYFCIKAHKAKREISKIGSHNTDPETRKKEKHICTELTKNNEYIIGSENDMVQYMDSQKYNSLDKSLIGFTDAQYESLSALIKDICQRNDIEFTRENVIGHEEYNPEKSDPGELFDWNRVFEG